MGRNKSILLIAIFITLILGRSALGSEAVCVLDSYNIPPTLKLKSKIVKLLKKRGYKVEEGKKCPNKVILGTPKLIEALKEFNPEDGKIIYTFILFPELLKIDKPNVYGIRIFPLPKRTVKAYFKKTHRKTQKVAVPISKKYLKVAKIYLDKKTFAVLTFRRTPEEVFKKLKKFKYAYIFPDPSVLRVINLINLIKFSKKNGIILITGLPDLKQYDVDFIQSVDYDKLSKLILKVLRENPKEKILPCPVRDNP